jgi:hypothetical protein
MLQPYPGQSGFFGNAELGAKPTAIVGRSHGGEPRAIDEYLHERLMPVEGMIPHLPGIEMYGDSIPVGTVGGDPYV